MGDVSQQVGQYRLVYECRNEPSHTELVALDSLEAVRGYKRQRQNACRDCPSDATPYERTQTAHHVRHVETDETTPVGPQRNKYGYKLMFLTAETNGS